MSLQIVEADNLDDYQERSGKTDSIFVDKRD